MLSCILFNLLQKNPKKNQSRSSLLTLFFLHLSHKLKKMKELRWPVHVWLKNNTSVAKLQNNGEHKQFFLLYYAKIYVCLHTQALLHMWQWQNLRHKFNLSLNPVYKVLGCFEYSPSWGKGHQWPQHHTNRYRYLFFLFCKGWTNPIRQLNTNCCL